MPTILGRSLVLDLLGDQRGGTMESHKNGGALSCVDPSRAVSDHGRTLTTKSLGGWRVFYRDVRPEGRIVVVM